MRLVPLLLLLGACAQYPDGCDRAAMRELRVVERLIEETRLNLARGYTYEVEDSRFGAGLVLCSGTGNVSFCSGNTSRGVRRPVAVDPAAEQRKLARLQERRDALLSNAVICRRR